jgi:hypothetical protein
VVHRDKLKLYYPPDPAWQQPPPATSVSTPVVGPVNTQDQAQRLPTTVSVQDFNGYDDPLVDHFNDLDPNSQTPVNAAPTVDLRPKRVTRTPARFQDYVTNQVYVNCLNVNMFHSNRLTSHVCLSFSHALNVTDASLHSRNGYPSFGQLVSDSKDDFEQDGASAKVRQFPHHDGVTAPTGPPNVSSAEHPPTAPNESLHSTGTPSTCSANQLTVPRRKHRARRQVRARRICAQRRYAMLTSTQPAD